MKYYEQNIQKAEELRPDVQDQYKGWINACEDKSLSFRVTEAYRTPERQKYLYTIGRRGVAGERPVTWVLHSVHQDRLAVDVFPINCTLDQIAEEAKPFNIFRPKATVDKGDYLHFECKPYAVVTVSPEARLAGLVRRLAVTRLESVRELLTHVIERLKKRL